MTGDEMEEARKQFEQFMTTTSEERPINGCALPWVIAGRLPDGTLDIRVGHEEVGRFFDEAGKAKGPNQ